MWTLPSAISKLASLTKSFRRTPRQSSTGEIVALSEHGHSDFRTPPGTHACPRTQRKNSSQARPVVLFSHSTFFTATVFDLREAPLLQRKQFLAAASLSLVHFPATPIINWNRGGNFSNWARQHSLGRHRSQNALTVSTSPTAAPVGSKLKVTQTVGRPSSAVGPSLAPPA